MMSMILIRIEDNGVNKPALKQTFHCRSCNRHRPMEQLGKIMKGNRSKRCIDCCDKADAANLLIAKGVV